MLGMIRKPVRDPWMDLLYNLERRMGRAFTEPLGVYEPFDATATTAWTPVVDIAEEEQFLRISAEIPGVKPEDVKITVEGNLLTIAGTKQQIVEEREQKLYRYERTWGAFERSFTLPATVDAEHIKATYDVGVLTLILPKVERAKPRQVKIEVKAEVKPALKP